MPVTFFLTEDRVIMSDGDWNGSPDNYFQEGQVTQTEDTNQDIEDSITLDTGTPYDLSSATNDEIVVELDVLGDHNDPVGETLTIKTMANDFDTPETDFIDMSTLLHSGASSNLWGGDIYQTDGQDGRPNMGAQPAQGDLFVVDGDGNEIQSVLGASFNGDADFTADTVDDIIDDSALLVSTDGEAAHINGSFDSDIDEITLDLSISQEFSADRGVDISQTKATASRVVDFDSDKDISNMVFYFSDGEGGGLKLKIDEFDNYWDNIGLGVDSTSTFDMQINDDALKVLFNKLCENKLNAKYDLDGDGDWTNDWEFAGFSTKAGNNWDRDYAEKVNQTRGEGEYIGLETLAEDFYGKEGYVACEIDAASFDGGDWISNIDDLFSP